MKCKYCGGPPKIEILTEVGNKITIICSECYGQQTGPCETLEEAWEKWDNPKKGEKPIYKFEGDTLEEKVYNAWFKQQQG
jgi:hypothetical protein